MNAESKKEATLVIIKPDGIQKSLTGNVLSRLSETRLIIIGSKMMSVSKSLAETHYQHLKNEKFFPDLIKYIMGKYHTDRVMALVYYGENAIRKVREATGSTNPEEATPYSLRGSYGRITKSGVFENVVHASANSEDAEREIKLWFGPDELTEKGIYPAKKETLQSIEASVWT